MSIVLIVQARMGSTRLPGKVLKEVLGKSLLEFQIERLLRVRFADNIVIATTTERADQPVVELCSMLAVPVYRGEQENVLRRYQEAAHFAAAEVIVRLSADCPLIDPAVIDQAIRFYLDHYPKYDYVSNTQIRTFPRGMDVEVFSRKALEEAALHAQKPFEKEHVTPYIYQHPDRFTLGNFVGPKDFSSLRLTVDTQEDFTLIKKILEELYPVHPKFTLEDILELMIQKHPEWQMINQQIKQKEL